MRREFPMRLIAMLTLLASVAAFVGCGKKNLPAMPFREADPPPSAADSDKARLQGVWLAESFQATSTNTELNFKGWGPYHYQFKGDQLTVARKWAISSQYTIVVNADQNPKWLTLNGFQEKREPVGQPVTAK